MKQFLVFAGSNYYPEGGFDDFKGDFDTTADAMKFLVENSDQHYDWWHIVDSTTKQIVAVRIKGGGKP